MNDNIVDKSLEVLKDYDKFEPIVVRRENRLSNIPNFYGEEFHGVLRRSAAEEMLRRAGEGAYLIRLSTSESCILSIIFNGKIFHYETNFDGSYLINGKRFSNVSKMVKNGFEIIEKHEMSNEKDNETENVKLLKLSHSFKSYQFKVPKNCNFCQNKIWGPFQKRQKCCNCGFSSHQNCSSKFAHDCLPNLKYMKRIFGVDLIVLCLAHNAEIPKIVEKCIEEIEKRGLKTVGIYRMSGSEEEIEALKNKFDGGSEVDLTVIKDIHSICSLLKLYLRSLPNPLIPCKILEIIFEQFQMDQPKTDEQKIEILRNELSKLDIFRRKTLACLFRHLKNVVQFSVQNRMDAHNLAIIFIPTLFRSLSIMDYGFKIKPAYFEIIKFLIEMPDIILV
uniref:Uncharacterized protein n=1 Tax=Panagrolaimus davidi TaxID=227884 RepID=A0A914QYE7_9BILA